MKEMDRRTFCKTVFATAGVATLKAVPLESILKAEAVESKSQVVVRFSWRRLENAVPVLQWETDKVTIPLPEPKLIYATAVGLNLPKEVIPDETPLQVVISRDRASPDDTVLSDWYMWGMVLGNRHMEPTQFLNPKPDWPTPHIAPVLAMNEGHNLARSFDDRVEEGCGNIIVPHSRDLHILFLSSRASREKWNLAKHGRLLHLWVRGVDGGANIWVCLCDPGKIYHGFGDDFGQKRCPECLKLAVTKQ